MHEPWGSIVPMEPLEHNKYVALHFCHNENDTSPHFFISKLRLCSTIYEYLSTEGSVSVNLVYQRYANTYGTSCLEASVKVAADDNRLHR